MGLPGAVGSMDCTHLYWEKCPVEWSNICTGKELHPTLSFQVVVDHSRRIHHVSRYFFGTFNDIQVTYADTYPNDVLSGTAYSDIIFELKNALGATSRWQVPVMFFIS